MDQLNNDAMAQVVAIMLIAVSRQLDGAKTGDRPQFPPGGN
jgi:hypothetical protein